ncbi:hypothetical protein [Heyndrickxia sporothermodurans]|uniref:hypothetical protein n=1 Tax=Heyndrickxia sporothermodurans TaxID=46224 RepID=UPI002E1AE89C|nr:hypothetical protein [Heyndrickxia sporothermodurans]
MSNTVPVRFDEDMKKKLDELDKYFNSLSSNKSAVIRYAVDELYKSINKKEQKS